MGIFRAKTALDLERVLERLDQAQTDLQAVEQEARERALDAALADNPAAAMAGIRERLARARELVEMLTEAHTEATRRERKRLAEAKDAAEKSRLAAIRGHLQQANKAAKAFSESFARCVAEHRELLRYLGKVEVLFTSHELREGFGSSGVMLHVNAMVLLELERLGVAPPGTPNAPRPFPGLRSTVANGLPLGVAVHQLPPLAERLRQRFEGIAGARPTPPPAAPEPEPQRPPDAPREQGGGLRPEASPVKPEPELIADWRGREIDPEPEVEPAPLEAGVDQ
jgi:hypothetical protein